MTDRITKITQLRDLIDQLPRTAVSILMEKFQRMPEHEMGDLLEILAEDFSCAASEKEAENIRRSKNVMLMCRTGR